MTLLKNHEMLGINLTDNLIIKKLIKNSKTSKNNSKVDLLQASEEYKNEFEIQSQLKGYKKLAFQDLQDL